MTGQETADPTLQAFLDAVLDQDGVTAREILVGAHDLPARSVHAAAALGRHDDLKRLLADHPGAARERAGALPAEPLLYLAYSPWHGTSPEIDRALLECARTLLAAGADPNTKDSRHGVPVLYAACGMRELIPLATLLLDAGANPTDGESVFHAAEKHHVQALELLLARGADLNFVGDWGNTALWFLLRWYDLGTQDAVRRGFEWLLAHGADPNMRSGKANETALHVAARLGQPATVIDALLAHGVFLDAHRADGRTAWQLAVRGGHDAVAARLERAGAARQTLTPNDRLISACTRGDVDEAARLASRDLIDALTEEERRLFVEAARAGRESSVRACLAAGFPIDALDEFEATALHHAAIEGRTAIVELLLDAGASPQLRDREHSATPLEWARFGEAHVQAAGADYPGTLAALQRPISRG